MNDIAVANWKADCISVFLQNGNNFNFSKNNYQTGTNPKLVLGCDIENDLDIDFVVVCEGDSRIDILLNNGHGLFSSHSNYNLDSQIASVVIEDFNSDGFGDMALTCGIGYNNYNQIWMIRCCSRYLSMINTVILMKLRLKSLEFTIDLTNISH